MQLEKIKSYRKSGPESKLQDEIVKFLEEREWLVLPTHGNAFQMGFPDLYCAHYTRGTRWVEVKIPDGYSFTPAQRQTFPKMQAKGVGIWIMCYADDYEYQKLFQPPNWHQFLNKTTHRRYG